MSPTPGQGEHWGYILAAGSREPGSGAGFPWEVKTGSLVPSDRGMAGRDSMGPQQKHWAEQVRMWAGLMKEADGAAWSLHDGVSRVQRSHS